MQRCTHPRFQLCAIITIHAAQSVMTCISPASFLRFRDIVYGIVGRGGITLDPRQMRVGVLDAALWRHGLENGEIRIVGTNLIDISKVDGILEYTQIKHRGHGIVRVVSSGNQ